MRTPSIPVSATRVGKKLEKKNVIIIRVLSPYRGISFRVTRRRRIVNYSKPIFLGKKNINKTAVAAVLCGGRRLLWVYRIITILFIFISTTVVQHDRITPPSTFRLFTRRK